MNAFKRHSRDLSMCVTGGMKQHTLGLSVLNNKGLNCVETGQSQIPNFKPNEE